MKYQLRLLLISLGLMSLLSLPGIAIGQTTKPVIDFNDFAELSRLLNIVNDKCKNPPACPEINISNAKKLAEAIGKTQYVLELYKQENDPSWLIKPREKAAKDYLRLNAIYEEKNKTRPERDSRENEKKALRKAYEHFLRYDTALKSVKNALSQLKATQDNFFNAVKKYFGVEHYGYDPAPNPIPDTAGIALLMLNQQLKTKIGILKQNVDLFSIRPYPAIPEIRLSKYKFRPGESIAVSFSALPCFAENAWIGIIPSGTQHNNENISYQKKIEYKHIAGKTRGTLSFTAPVKGQYDFRMFDSEDNGKEISSVAFKVMTTEEMDEEHKNSAKANAKFKSADLTGTWEATGYTCQGRTMATETVTITLQNEILTATKVTGDSCVPAGEVTWEGTLKGALISGRGRVSNGSTIYWRYDVTINVIDGNTLRGFNGVNYKRKKTTAYLVVRTPKNGCGEPDVLTGIEIRQNGYFVKSSSGPTEKNKNALEVKPPPYRFEMKPGIYNVTFKVPFKAITTSVEMTAGSEKVLSLGEIAGNLETRIFDHSGNRLKVWNFSIVISKGGEQVFKDFGWHPLDHYEGYLPLGRYKVTISYIYTNKQPYLSATHTKEIEITSCKPVILDFRHEL